MDTDSDKAQEFVEKIEVEAQYLNDMVSELLDLSRIESGQAAMTLEPIEAERLVREVMARMLPLAQRHRVSLHTDIQQGKTCVIADSRQITRVLVNLVHNAVKFTPSGGTITVGTNELREQHVQRFFVRDTGVGIRSEELPRVFERFYKTDRARSKADYFGPWWWRDRTRACHRASRCGGAWGEVSTRKVCLVKEARFSLRCLSRNR